MKCKVIKKQVQRLGVENKKPHPIAPPKPSPEGEGFKKLKI